MKVAGIIAEYNPFHNGHKYQIEQIRQKTGADYIIVAMSGNFLQRGVPALCDKFTRAKMALACGADLVFELPSVWSTSSAEYFAKGGVSLLANTGVVTHLCFGAESDDLPLLTEIASALTDESEEYRTILADALRSGLSFPIARKKALLHVLPHVPSDRLNKLLDSPNNILALEYRKALPESITPVLIPRKGAGYHNSDIDQKLPSATAIRETIFAKKNDNSRLRSAMPEESYAILTPLLQTHAVLETNDFTEALGYRLLSLSQEGYVDFADCSEDFSNKIRKNLTDYTTMEEFALKLKSKDMTYTRISRNLLHILLDIRQTDYTHAKSNGFVPYLRLLGFRKNASPLLREIKACGSAPIITKAAEAQEKLSPSAYAVFEKDLFASAIYYQTLARRCGQRTQNEFTSQIIIL